MNKGGKILDVVFFCLWCVVGIGFFPANFVFWPGIGIVMQLALAVYGKIPYNSGLGGYKVIRYDYRNSQFDWNILIIKIVVGVIAIGITMEIMQDGVGDVLRHTASLGVEDVCHLYLPRITFVQLNAETIGILFVFVGHGCRPPLLGLL